MTHKGLTLQGAVDAMDVEFRGLMERFFEAEERLRTFGSPEVDERVQKYIAGLKYWTVGSLHWSFKSKRYFGSRNEEIKRTLLVQLKRRIAADLHELPVIDS